MNNPIQLTNTVSAVRGSKSLTIVRRGLPRKQPLQRSQAISIILLILLGVTWSAMSDAARADDCEQGCDFLFRSTYLGQEALVTKIGLDNTAIGFYALNSNQTGADNTAVGSGALRYNTASQNTGIGTAALNSNTTGVSNTATGYFSLLYNINGSRNVATGASALLNNTSGNENTATGANALSSNTTGNNNTASGASALKSNTTGVSNTASGWQALFANTTGNNNTASGLDALLSNTTGLNNTASGVLALGFNTTGSSNTATGISALQNNTIGANNTATGQSSLQSNTAGNSNIAMGFSAGMNLTTGSNNIDIGNVGVAGDNARIRIGTRLTHKNTFIAGIFGVPVPTGVAVLVDNSGHLGTTTSSARFKKNIQPMDKASEAIHALHPVSFRYKEEFDPAATPQFGLVAEEVEKVNPDLVVRDEEGKPYSVRYEAVNAMLLNEFLKEHRRGQEQDATIAQQQKEIQALRASLHEQAAQIEKISALVSTQATARVGVD